MYIWPAGQFGRVYKAQMMPQNLTVAVKTVQYMSRDFQREMTIMTGIVHPNIVQLYGMVNEGTTLPIYCIQNRGLPISDMMNNVHDAIMSILG